MCGMQQSLPLQLSVFLVDNFLDDAINVQTLWFGPIDVKKPLGASGGYGAFICYFLKGPSSLKPVSRVVAAMVTKTNSEAIEVAYNLCCCTIYVANRRDI